MKWLGDLADSCFEILPPPIREEHLCNASPKRRAFRFDKKNHEMKNRDFIWTVSHRKKDKFCPRMLPKTVIYVRGKPFIYNWSWKKICVLFTELYNWSVKGPRFSFITANYGEFMPGAGWIQNKVKTCEVICSDACFLDWKEWMKTFGKGCCVLLSLNCPTVWSEEGDAVYKIEALYPHSQYNSFKIDRWIL